MKYLKRTSLLTLAAFALLGSSCGEKKEAAGEQNDSPAAESSKATPASIADQAADEFATIMGALSKVTDKASAEAARDTISKSADELIALSETLKTLDKPSAADAEAIEKKMDARMEEIMKDFTPPSPDSIRATPEELPEIMKIIEEAMKTMDEKTKEAGKVFEEYFEQDAPADSPEATDAPAPAPAPGE
ncbi:MAG: hypothetical protein ACQKBY_08890 [Verrucomicrobiales bacterium]